MESTGLLCAGARNGVSSQLDSCIQWSPDSGSWAMMNGFHTKYHRAHVSWTPDTGIGTYLMGGGDRYLDYLKNTLVKPDGTKEAGFQLEYGLRYGVRCLYA